MCMQDERQACIVAEAEKIVLFCCNIDSCMGVAGDRVWLPSYREVEIAETPRALACLV